MQRVTITLDDDLMADLDRIIAARGYQNRSEAIRDLARSGLEQAFTNVGRPDILADRHAQPHPPQRHRSGQRAGGEDALLVEGAVVGQVVLAGDAGDPAMIDQRHRIV